MPYIQGDVANDLTPLITGGKKADYKWCQQNCTGYYNNLIDKAPGLVLDSACQYTCGCLATKEPQIEEDLLGCGGSTPTIWKYPDSCVKNVVKTKSPTSSVKESFENIIKTPRCECLPNNGGGTCDDKAVAAHPSICPATVQPLGCCCRQIIKGQSPGNLPYCDASIKTATECASQKAAWGYGNWCPGKTPPTHSPTGMCFKRYATTSFAPNIPGGKCLQCIVQKLKNKSYKPGTNVPFGNDPDLCESTRDSSGLCGDIPGDKGKQAAPFCKIFNPTYKPQTLNILNEEPCKSVCLTQGGVPSSLWSSPPQTN